MLGKDKIVFLGVLLALFLLPSLVQTGGPRVVYLKATFSSDLVNSIAMPTKITSDGKGSYQNASNVTVQFSDLGELQFIIGERASRRVNFIFGWDNWLSNGPCATCAGETWPDMLNEPTTYVSFLTTISTSHKGPQLNFLAMKPGDLAPVRLAVYFETKARKYFRLRYYNGLDPEEYCGAGGPVMVQAIDTNLDGTVDRWVLYPVQDGTNKALFFREYARKGNDWLQCSFGYFAMPFELTLDRL